MTIQRSFGGKTYDIELTDEELFEAYLEKEHMFDIQDVTDMLNGMSDFDINEYYGVTREEAVLLIDEIANEMRRDIDKYDMSWQNARDEAIETVLRRAL